MSKKSPSAPGPGPAETTQANISKEMYDTTDPLRNLWMNEFMKLYGYENAALPSSFQNAGGNAIAGTEASRRGRAGKMGANLPGDAASPSSPSYTYTGQTYDPTQSVQYQPMYNAARTAANQGYGQAKDAIIANTARGGAQTAALSMLERDAAKERANVPYMISSEIISDLMQKGYGTAFGAPQQALAGLSGSTAAEIQRNNASLQAQTATNMGKKNTGAALGTIAGLAAFGPAGAAAGGGGTTMFPAASLSQSWAAPTAFFS